jgi:hypothetical protein
MITPFPKVYAPSQFQSLILKRAKLYQSAGLRSNRKAVFSLVREALAACEQAGWHSASAIDMLVSKGWHSRCGEEIVDRVFQVVAVVKNTER